MLGGAPKVPSKDASRRLGAAPARLRATRGPSSSHLQRFNRPVAGGTAIATLAGMTSTDLRHDQAEALTQSLGKQARYLSRLVERMDRLGFPKDDRFYAQAMRARDATISLLGTAHELRDQATKPAWMRAYSGGQG